MKYFIIAIVLIIAPGLQANPLANYSSRSLFLTLSAGPSFYRGGHTQTLYLQPEIANTYTNDSDTQPLISGELFFGVEHLLISHLITQLGITLAMNGSARLRGEIWETADPLFDNWNDQYYIKHHHIALKGQLFFEHWNQDISPYINGSVGIGFNSAYGFDAAPTIFETASSPLFQDHQQTTLTYTLGLGLQKSFSQLWRCALGYQFSDWGKSHLERASEQTLNQGLQENHFYTHELVISINYRFGAF